MIRPIAPGVCDRPGPDEAYFAVLPDHEAGPAVASALRAPGARTLLHASGRPWLVGRWDDEQITVAEAGRTRLAIIGCCPIDAERLAVEAGRLRHLAQLDRLARSLPGSFHLVAALDGRLRVQGTASGLRLVWHARVDGLTVAADRADILAAAVGSDLDVRQLAVRLLWPVPHPLQQGPMWRKVSAVAPGRHLLVDTDGRTTRHGRWWTPPEPVRTLAAGADDVRRALTDAVAARTGSGGTVSVDLSGGLDSTSLCFLAGRQGEAQVIAATWPGRDPADDDLRWARRAAGHLPGTEHAVWPAEESPLVYADLLEIDDTLDEPTIGVMDRARLLAHVPRLLAKGSRLHLTGIGGDHVAWCSEAGYHGLLRRRPVLAVERLRGLRALFHWPMTPMVRALADCRSYRRWLADAASDLRAPTPPTVVDALGWGGSPRMFPWITDDAVSTAADAIRDAARHAQPLAPDRGRHADLHAIRDCSRIIRQWEQMSARAGLPMASPYLDDRVIEACLSVRVEDRVTPWRYKPVLAAAMRGIVPDECLRRTTKAEAALDAAEGLRLHGGDLQSLWEDSRLARLGLVDAAALKDLTGCPDDPRLRQAILYSTIGCEVWLRTLEPAAKGMSR
ncbi:lasso peptide isopeptide bond-forming cyclase [Thermomonospora umbrina]|uniref:asparagine synthase (glutamine-hydrolyzing) n=1 Tax=Thermomonospora umbrina TaxID=111806 RepID=A0A3D9SVZ4_9ACTN|nr:lasso peptide isopeptide bond-forming cyclase [Thermomonospora umbrina]REE96754.1 asparagine synthase (glutamine-hydrolysing) [Thermomonospora umbrina]